jgi:choline-sulfatase
MTDRLSHRQCNRPVDTISVFPTLIELCGLPALDHVEGYSVVPLLQNPRAPWTNPAITSYDNDRHQAIRMGKWHYIQYGGINGGEELYDVDADEPEWFNVASSHQGTVESLKNLLPLKAPAVQKFK